MVVLPLNKRNTGGISMVLLYFLQHRCGTANITVCFSAPCQRVNYAYPVRVYHHRVACLAQALLGHRRAIMEGPTGLWWSTILTVTVGEAARGTPFDSIASSLAVGIFFSAVLTIIIGVSGIGHRLAKLFSPTVMVFFMLLLGAQLTTIFFKGMLGLPFSSTQVNLGIQLAPFCLALSVMILVLGMIIFSRMVSLATPC